MGGSAEAPPIQQQGTPVQVPPFGDPYQGGAIPTPVQPPQSSKGGTMAGLPSLDALFSAPQGGASVFAPSQSFPQPPINAARTAAQPGGDSRMRLLPVGSGIPAGPWPGPGAWNQPGPFARLMQMALRAAEGPMKEPSPPFVERPRGDPKTPNDTVTYA